MAGGRKLEFDKSQALESAMRVFWEKGFVGASLTDLTETMGIKKPSMYATFGNKEELFIQATGHYLEKYANSHIHFLEDDTQPVLVRLKNYLLSVIHGQLDEKTPKGCYISLSVSESASGCMPEKAMNTVSIATEAAITNLNHFFNSVSAELPLSNAEAEQNALFLVTMLHGTAAMARSGKTIEELEPLIDKALAAIKQQ